MKRKFNLHTAVVSCVLVRQVAGSLLATLRQLRHLNQLLLIPLTMYSGFEQAALSAEWSRVSLLSLSASD